MARMRDFNDKKTPDHRRDTHAQPHFMAEEQKLRRKASHNLIGFS